MARAPASAFDCDASFDVRDQPDVPLFLADVDMVSLAKVLVIALCAVAVESSALFVPVLHSRIRSALQSVLAAIASRCPPPPPPTSYHALLACKADLHVPRRCDVLRDEDVAITFDAASRAMPGFCSVVNTAGVAANGREGAQTGGWTRIMDINAGGTIR